MRKTIAMTIAAVMISAYALAADGSLPRPLANAKAGEWMLLRDVSGEHAGERIKFTIVEVKGEGADRAVTMKSERFGADGSVVETIDMNVPLSRYEARMTDLEAKAKQISRERLTVKDREIAVYAVSWDDDDGSREFKIWLSDDIPAGGIVKSWSSDPGFPAAELIDYGS